MMLSDWRSEINVQVKDKNYDNPSNDLVSQITAINVNLTIITEIQNQGYKTHHVLWNKKWSYKIMKTKMLSNIYICIYHYVHEVHESVFAVNPSSNRDSAF